MATVIASTYEIIREIGSGGGGVVYLGRHLRLDKLVVLKADKRFLNVNPEVLRREVDTLKNLRHSYIPQVYDFVEEDGVVYTVMEYVEGESLNKPLSRGERFGQAQIIHWAKQLLEALCYLHSRPPYGLIHGDIKPANIMLTPGGDICLIDFNIALALGEEGTVRVGFSKGYAAPEEYADGCEGLPFDTSPTDFLIDSEPPANPLSGRVRSSVSGHRFISVVDSKNQSANSYLQKSPKKRHSVFIDVRSDIYSVGATLYHLLTGTRPAANAKDVVPISAYSNENISPLVAEIVTKAMNLNPNLRYQTAAEMLYQFTHLMENDSRTKRHRQRALLSAVCASFMFALGSAFCVAGSREQISPFDFNIIFSAIRPWIWPSVSAVLFLSLMAVIALFIQSRKPKHPRIIQPIIENPENRSYYSPVDESDENYTMLLTDSEPRILLSLVDVNQPEYTFSAPLGDSMDSHITIGRSPSNAIALDYDKSVSLRHCEIFRQGVGFYIKDLHSANGTFVDNVAVQESAEITDGCVIRLGRLEFKVGLQ